MATILGFQINIGNKVLALDPAGHAGPSSYVQLTTGPLAGGDVLQAVDFGLKFFEHVSAGLSSDGVNRVEVVNPTDAPVTSVRLRWVVVATGAQVAGAVDLSGSVVNILAIGV